MIAERRILVGLIVSADFLRRVAPFWDDTLLESREMARVARWCLDHWARYQRPPDRDIEQIYMTAIREESIPRAEAEIIEGTLQSISDEYGRGDQFNAAYLFDITVQFFRDREVVLVNEQAADLRERGRLDDAERLLAAWTPRSWATTRGLDLGTDPGYDRVRSAFARGSAPIITYPGALGGMLNRHLIRDGFVAIMAPEKRGKTHCLTDMAFRALRQRCNVAFFQAGDMTESQYLRRLSVHLARRSDDPAYCVARHRPVGDCALNQFDDCDRVDRNCDHGVFPDSSLEEFREDPTKYQRHDVLLGLVERNPDYRPCDAHGCSARWPVVWLKPVPERSVLTGSDAARTVREFFERYRRRFRLATYPSGTLTCEEMRSCLAEWEQQDDFVPDVVVVDYADIMAADDREYRHRQNAIWMGLRAVSQERHALVVTATQTDADSYKSDLLRLGNFVEDKRKFGHVTAMFGLNQDPKGREKDLGIMRINTILAREGAFNSTETVTVLQDLASGRPFVESFRRGPTTSVVGDQE